MNNSLPALPEGFRYQFGSAIREKADGELWDYAPHTDLEDARSAVAEWYEEDEETEVRDCVVVYRITTSTDGWVEYLSDVDTPTTKE